MNIRDDFDHYFDATQRLTAENRELRAKVEHLEGEIEVLVETSGRLSQELDDADGAYRLARRDNDALRQSVAYLHGVLGTAVSSVRALSEVPLRDLAASVEILADGIVQDVVG